MLNLRENDKIEGWMSLIELLFLYELAQKMDKIAELGSYKGRSTYALCSGCHGQVLTIDDFSMTDRQSLYRNVGHFNNLTIIDGKSDEFALPIDMLFIDADHTYEAVKKDIETWRPYVKRLICGHDYDIDSVKQAVLETLGEPDEVVGSIWIKWIK